MKEGRSRWLARAPLVVPALAAVCAGLAVDGAAWAWAGLAAALWLGARTDGWRGVFLSLGAAVAVVALVVSIGWLGSVPAAAQTRVIKTSELRTAPARYDGATITVEGELIGDYGFRGSGMMWTQLNDDSYARAPIVDGGELTGSNLGIGIRMPGAIAEGLSPPGGYRTRGPIVRATGQWKYHDPERQGETYLEVFSIEIVEGGIRLSEGPNPAAIIGGLVLLVVALGVMLRYVRPRGRA